MKRRLGSWVGNHLPTVVVATPTTAMVTPTAAQTSNNLGELGYKK